MLTHGDLFDVLPTLAEASLDACVTDPPYGLGFMGKAWDTFKPGEAERRIVPNAAIESDNPNLRGRKRGPASSPSAVEYDRSLSGQRAFQAWTERWAREVYRVLKPGAHLVVCGAPRSYHRMASGLEDAGFEIRDCVAYLFGQGFPKSLNFGCKCGGNELPYNHAAQSTAERDMRSLFDADVSPSVNAGDEPREVLLNGVPKQGVPAHGHTDGTGVDEGREQSELARRQLHRTGEGLSDDSDAEPSESASERLRAGAHHRRRTDAREETETGRGSASSGPRSSEQPSDQSANLRLPSGALGRGASDRDSRCERCGGITAARGQGTGLKPGYEPVVIARKPLDGTVAENFRKHGTGAMNIDACRIEFASDDDREGAKPASLSVANDSIGTFKMKDRSHRSPDDTQSPLGRWPANVALDEDAAQLLDEMSGERVSGANPTRRGSDKFRGVYSDFVGQEECTPARGMDIGGASRFFYVAKPSRGEREIGCDYLPERQRDESRKEGNPGGDNPRNRGVQQRGNHHPTVKPIELMRWLVRLVTPANGTVLDPFTGSGTTGCACAFELRPFIGIEREAEYVEIAKRRIAECAPLFQEQVS